MIEEIRIGDLCRIVEPRSLAPKVQIGEYLYSNGNVAVKVGDILLVSGIYRNSDDIIQYYTVVNHLGIHVDVNALFVDAL